MEHIRANVIIAKMIDREHFVTLEIVCIVYYIRSRTHQSHLTHVMQARGRCTLLVISRWPTLIIAL